jgi:hypothetical protein
MCLRTAPRLKLYRQNLRTAKRKGTQLSHSSIALLRELTARFGLSVTAGELTFVGGTWYITHSGLLRLACRRHCRGIDVAANPELCDPSSARWVFRATVYTSAACKGFVGHGDADPSNVSARVRGAEMRVAETRAVNRALRKAYGIGICSVEELGSFSGPLPSAASQAGAPKTSNGNGQHPLRDRLCLLIRQHRLDPALVKAYAADYCDVAELRQASREQVATFIKHLAEYAAQDREGLLSQLNSCSPRPVAAAVVETTNDIPQAEQEKAAGAA